MNKDDILENIFNDMNFVNKEEELKIIREKYENELEDYIYIDSIKDLKKCKLGGYFRFINKKREIRYGGIYYYLNYDSKSEDYTIITKNSSFRENHYDFEEYYVFYKKHVSSSDKTRKLFISMLEKYE